MISVIIPAYNAVETITKCLDALRHQTYTDVEVIVVDDGSKDATVEIVRAYARKWNRVHLIEKANGGAPSARNRGLKESTGELVLFCDADVVHKPDALQKLAHALEKHPDASFAYSSFQFGWKEFALFPFDVQRLKQMPYIHTNSLVRRADLPPGGWDESLKRFQDWDLFLTMAEEGKIGILVSEVLFQVISTRGTMSRWMPSFVFKLPWQIIGWKPKTIRKYDEGMAIIKKKHNL